MKKVSILQLSKCLESYLAVDVSTIVETIDLPILEKLSKRFLSASNYYGPVKLALFPYLAVERGF